MVEGEVFDVTSEEWEDEILGSVAPEAVDFWHERCSWCTRLEPFTSRWQRSTRAR